MRVPSLVLAILLLQGSNPALARLRAATGVARPALQNLGVFRPLFPSARSEFSPASVSQPAELRPAAQLDTRSWDPWSAGGSQSTHFRDPESGDVLKVFTVRDVQEKHVRALVKISEYLREAGLPIVPMRFVQTDDGRPAIRMPFVSGESAGRLIDRRNPDGILTDAESFDVHTAHFATLKAIDRMTGGLSDRRGGLTSNMDDYENSIVASEPVNTENGSLFEAGTVVNIDPINMLRLIAWMDGEDLRSSAVSEPGFINVYDWSGPSTPEEQRVADRVAEIAASLKNQ